SPRSRARLPKVRARSRWLRRSVTRRWKDRLSASYPVETSTSTSSPSLLRPDGLKHPQIKASGRWMAARQAAVHDQRRAVDITGFVRREVQRRVGNLFRFTAAIERIDLADAVLLSCRAG